MKSLVRLLVAAVAIVSSVSTVSMPTSAKNDVTKVANFSGDQQPDCIPGVGCYPR